MQLFSRLLIQVERSENIQSLFAYDLAPIPTALFKDNVMMKGKKSSLASFLKDGVTPAEISEMRDAKFVIDRGRTVTSCLLEIRFLIHGCCISVWKKRVQSIHSFTFNGPCLGEITLF